MELKSDVLHDYSSIIIEKDGCLTTNEWNPKIRHGGKLYLKILNDLILKDDGFINLNGKGYKGANNPNETGESIYGKATYSLKNQTTNNNKKFVSFNKNYYGGGGSGGTHYSHGKSPVGTCGYGGGGGGYGSIGFNGQYFDHIENTTTKELKSADSRSGIGGKKYGKNNKYFKKGIYLGSGGGSGMVFKNNWQIDKDNELKRDYKIKIIGGNGGGALFIDCGGSVIINNHKCKIQCEGDKGNHSWWSGSGSGGSIYIKFGIDLCIGNNCIISVIGGVNQQCVGMYYYDGTESGQGGNGRIYIEYTGKNNKYILNNSHRIVPIVGDFYGECTMFSQNIQLNKYGVYVGCNGGEDHELEYKVSFT
eukprot:492596_1